MCFCSLCPNREKFRQQVIHELWEKAGSVSSHPATHWLYGRMRISDVS